METTPHRSPDGQPATHFVVGMSRSGTTWMAQCLNRHSEIACFGETGFWGRNYVSPSEAGGYGSADLEAIIDKLQEADSEVTSAASEVGGPAAVLRQLVDSLQSTSGRVSPGELFGRWASEIAAREEANLAVEKTPHHINWLDRIDHYFPQAKFIALYRRPYDFMLSYKYQGRQTTPREREEFQKIYHPAGCATVYRGYLRSLRETRRAYPDRSLFVELGDIKRDSEAVLRGVQSFLECPLEDIDLEPQNSSFPDDFSPTLDAADIFWMNAIAGPEICRHGYELRRIPRDPGTIARSFAELPGWAMHVLRHLSKTSNVNPVAYIWDWIRA